MRDQRKEITRLIGEMIESGGAPEDIFRALVEVAADLDDTITEYEDAMDLDPEFVDTVYGEMFGMVNIESDDLDLAEDGDEDDEPPPFNYNQMM